MDNCDERRLTHIIGGHVSAYAWLHAAACKVACRRMQGCMPPPARLHAAACKVACRRMQGCMPPYARLLIRRYDNENQ